MEDLAAMVVTMALRRVKKPEPLLALLDGMREPILFFLTQHSAASPLEKNHPVHSFY